MVRVYKTVRLAYEAKVWIDELIQKNERKIKELSQDNFLNTLEQTLFNLKEWKVSLSRLWTRLLRGKIPCLQRRVWDMVVLSSVWFVTSQKKWQSFLTCLTIPTLFLGLPLACQINNMMSNQDCLWTKWYLKKNTKNSQ